VSFGLAQSRGRGGRGGAELMPFMSHPLIDASATVILVELQLSMSAQPFPSAPVGTLSFIGTSDFEHDMAVWGSTDRSICKRGSCRVRSLRRLELVLSALAPYWVLLRHTSWKNSSNTNRKVLPLFQHRKPKRHLAQRATKHCKKGGM
jgi:hypothetical protein